MPDIFDSILNRLQSKELILPHLEAAIMSDSWPSSYQIEVDSSPYYGAGDGYFHPSSHPLKGERQLYYMFHPDTRGKMIPERRDLSSHMILGMGSALHALVQTKLLRSGLITDPSDIEVEYVNDEHHVRGRLDGIISHPNGKRYVFEMKTINPFSFKKLDGKPQDSWRCQTAIGVDNAPGDVEDDCIMLLMETGFPYNLHEMIVPIDRELLGGIYDKFDRVREAIATNTPPRHCCLPNSPEMKKCPARAECWLKDESQ